MGSRSFAGFTARPSPWGYNWTSDVVPNDLRPLDSSQAQPPPPSDSPEPQMLAQQYANMPAALLTSLKRDKKPFTYTPGGVNLSEVLNARMQKRAERKKRYMAEHRAPDPVDDLPRFDPPKQVIVMPTYNSPLDMYSMANALEALEVQAGLVASEKSLGSPGRSATLPRNHRFDEKDFDADRGVTQSKAFKVLQIITDTENDTQRGRGSPSHQDEMRFTGIRDSKTIPSRFFQTLQKMTGTEDEAPGAARVDAPVVFEKQQTRSQDSPVPAKTSFHHPSSKGQHKTVTFQEPGFGPALKRPAAFLPQKGPALLPHVKSVQPSFLSNGTRKAFNPTGGTDF